MSLRFVRQAQSHATGSDAERLDKSWPGCRIDASAFVEKESEWQPSGLPVSRGA